MPSSTRRPLALVGPSGSGKTSLLRGVLGSRVAGAKWTTARDLVDEARRAIRSERFAAFRQAFAADPRPLVVEHVEDLREKPRTMEEIRLLVEGRVVNGHAVTLTLTVDQRTRDVLEWLRSFTRVVRLTPSDLR